MRKGEVSEAWQSGGSMKSWHETWYLINTWSIGFHIRQIKASNLEDEELYFGRIFVGINHDPVTGRKLVSLPCPNFWEWI